MKNIKSILIQGVPFSYEAVNLNTKEPKPMSFEEAKDLLFTSKNLLSEYGIKIYFVYGTLLGALREHSFISHDYDIDVYTDQYDELLKNVPELYKKGLKLCRVQENKLLSFSYNGFYLDIYIKKDAPFPWIWCKQIGHDILPAKLVNGSEEIDFLGGKFLVPANPEKLIVFFYGKTWRTPIKGKHAKSSIIPIHIWRYFAKPMLCIGIGWPYWRHLFLKRFKSQSESLADWEERGVNLEFLKSFFGIK